MRKLLCVILVALNLTIPGFAVTSSDEMKLEESIAYMSMDEASPELQQQILLEREKIIFSHSWVADGIDARVLDENGNIEEELPHFSDLFPEDWEVPTITTSPNSSATKAPGPFEEELRTNGKWDWDLIFQDSVWLKKPPETTGSPAFFSLETTAFGGTPYVYYIETVSTTGIYRNPAEEANYNCAYTDTDTGKVYSYKVGLENGKPYEIDPPKDISLSIHASTHTNVGDWQMTVSTKRVWPDPI